jgi:hypothetical protein
MKFFTCTILAITISGCATSPNSFDRNSHAWASTIVGCQSAYELTGTSTDKAVWAYEKRALLTERNGGWPSDHTRLSTAVKKNKQQLLTAGDAVASQKLAKCQKLVSALFPEGHPAT